MNRYQNTFAKLKSQRKTAFVPFTVLGDPNPDTSYQIIRTYIQSGAHMVELGIPFSDPIADGPIIQAANIRALTAGMNTEKVFLLVKKIRNEFPDIPIGLLVYANLVVAKGIQEFYERAVDAGVDSVLIADVPIHESTEFHQAALAACICPVYICPPNATEEKIALIAQRSQGYVYVVSRSGVTGLNQSKIDSHKRTLKLLNEHHSAPTLLGFGIRSTADQTKAINQNFSGVICGSALVDKIPAAKKVFELLGKLEKELSLFITNS
jgi:tryptophan synthase alpha chain